MQEVRRFPCVPCFIFPKVSWSESCSFPVLTVPPVWMTGGLSGIIYVIKHGLQWKDVPDEYRPHRSLYNRLVRWSKRGVFKKNFNKLSNQTPFDGSLMLDSTHLKVRRTAASLLKKGILHVSSAEQKEA